MVDSFGMTAFVEVIGKSARLATIVWHTGSLAGKDEHPT